MISQDRDYEDILRGALRAAAESIEPADDGLERIRHRSHSRRSARSMLAQAADWLRLFWIRLIVRLESFRWRLSQEPSEQLPAAHYWPVQLVTMASRLAALRRYHGRHGTGQQGHDGRTPAGKAAGRLGPGAAWLRPALAVAGVVAVVMVGIFALNRAQETEITPTNSVTSPPRQHPPAVAGRATPTLWQPPPAAAQPGQQASPKSQNRTATSAPTATSTPTCNPTPKASKTPGPTASASATPSPTPSNTGSPTPSATPTHSGSPWNSPTTSGGRTPRTSRPKATTDVMLSPGTACGSKATPKATGTAS